MIKYTKLEKLQAEKIKLFSKALKQFPNSPTQKKTKIEIEKVSKKIEAFKKKIKDM
jgi:hypothetical protein